MARRIVPWETLVAGRPMFAACPRNGVQAIILDRDEPRILQGVLDGGREVLLLDLDDLPEREGPVVGFGDLDDALRDAVIALGSA